MKKKPFDDVIADGYIRPARGWVKGKKTVYIAIGRPRPDEDPKKNWFCPVFIEKFLPRTVQAHGVGSLDALFNAMNLLRQFFDMNTIASLEWTKSRPTTPPTLRLVPRRK
jgi:hypothetical protein